MHSQEEIQLIAKAREDIRHFEGLYQNYFEKIYRYVFHRTLQRDMAEDIVQQTFLRAIEHFDSYHDQGVGFGAWLYRIAHNLVVDEFRKKRFASLDEAHAISGEGESDIIDSVDVSIDRQKLDICLSELPPHYRDVVDLKKQGLKVRDISAVLEKTESAVKVAFFRAVKMLRNCLFGSV